MLLLGLVLLLPASVTAQEVADSPERKAGEIFVRGMTRSFLGDDEGAIALFREALTHTPDNPSILGAMADAQRRLGDLDSALFFARRAAQVAPDRAETQLLVSDLLSATGNVSDAVSVLDELAERFPDDVDVLRARANLLYRAEQRTAARDAYRDLVERTGGDDSEWLRLLDLETSLGRLEEALTALEALELRRPGDAALLQRHAEILIQLDRPDEAVAAFRRVLSLSPGNREAIEALESLQPAAPGDDTPALPFPGRSADEWLQIVRDNPRNVDAWTAAVRALRREGRVTEALRTADDGLLLFPGAVDLEIETGMAALLAMLPDQALTRFGEAAMILSEREEEDMERFAIVRAGRWLAESLDEGTGSLPRDLETALGNEADLHTARALAALGMATSDPARALRWSAAVLQADPGNPFALAARAGALAANGRVGDGLALLRPVLDGDSPAPLLLVVAGDLAASEARPDEARAFFERASAASPGSVLIRARLERP